MNYAAFEGKTPLEIFRLIAPEFAAVSDDVVNNYLELATVFVCAGDYGKYYNVAVALMAAHIMASPGGYSDEESTSSGKVQSRKEGDLAITYGNVSSDTSYLGGTTYGNLLQMLRKKMGGGYALMTRGVVGGLFVSVKIIDNKRLWNNFSRELKAIGRKEVVAGIQQGAIKDGLQVAEYAAWNEFGTRTIPARPFMRTYFDSSVARLETFSTKGVTQVLLGKATFSQFLNAAGSMMVDGIQRSITNGNWTPNAAYTIAKKGSAKPLIDTGTMRQSVTFAIQPYGTSK